LTCLVSSRHLPSGLAERHRTGARQYTSVATLLVHHHITTSTKRWAG